MQWLKKGYIQAYPVGNEDRFSIKNAGLFMKARRCDGKNP
jgi:hypothetical protein